MGLHRSLQYWHFTIRPEMFIHIQFISFLFLLSFCCTLCTAHTKRLIYCLCQSSFNGNPMEIWMQCYEIIILHPFFTYILLAKRECTQDHNEWIECTHAVNGKERIILSKQNVIFGNLWCQRISFFFLLIIFGFLNLGNKCIREEGSFCWMKWL